MLPLTPLSNSVFVNSVPSFPSSTATSLQMSSSSAVVPPPPLWVQNAGQLAPWAAVGVFLAPIPTLRDVQKQQSVGSLPLLPYSAMIGNCFLWLVYGLLKKESKIWSCNGVGLLLGMWYFVTFVKNIPKKSSEHNNNPIKSSLPGTVIQHLQGIGAIVAATLGMMVMLRNPADLIGNLGVILAICLMGSPLAALKTVLETKSAKSIPLPFALATVANGFLWSVAGLLDMKDFNVYFPNLLGMTFGLIQVFLKLIYGDGTSSSKPAVDLPM